MGCLYPRPGRGYRGGLLKYSVSHLTKTLVTGTLETGYVQQHEHLSQALDKIKGLGWQGSSSSMEHDMSRVRTSS